MGDGHVPATSNSQVNHTAHYTSSINLINAINSASADTPAFGVTAHYSHSVFGGSETPYEDIPAAQRPASSGTHTNFQVINYSVFLTGSAGSGMNGFEVITDADDDGTADTDYYKLTSPAMASGLGSPSPLFGNGQAIHTFASGAEASSSGVVAAIFPSGSGDSSNTEQDFSSAAIVAGNGGSATIKDFKITSFGGITSPSMSLSSVDSNYISNVLGTDPHSPKSKGYVYFIFKDKCDSTANTNSSQALTIDVTTDSAYGVANGYSSAKTPFITGPQTDTSNIRNLFRFETLSDGDNANREIKVGILNIKEPGKTPGTDYSSFDVVVRAFDDTDKRQTVLETWAGVTLDPDSVNYIARRIGDIKFTFNTTKKKVEVATGDYPVKSNYIRVIMNGVPDVNEYPFGHKEYLYPITTAASSGKIDIPFFTSQIGSDGESNTKIFHGAAFDSTSGSLDILPYLNPTPDTNVISSSKFSLDVDCSLTVASSSLTAKKFIVGFQGGTDGFNPRRDIYDGLGPADPSNSGANKTDFTNAIKTISNPDEIDVNMLVLPGINKTDHSNVHVEARTTAEDRADTFYVFDAGNYNSTISDVTTQVEQEDSNYSATYFPWVKINDEVNNKHVWVPPSVVVPGVIAFTDKVSHPWFAPAGLNRGGLGNVIYAKERLTQDERDTLYEGRVNPIATFPGEGVCIWGQKTLQAKPSALDRVNVRRLLIRMKKFIAASSRFLVFEQNTEATRQKFLNIVNPFLEQIQSNSGLTSFRVVMDETNNTPDTIDRNQLIGQIFIQPARTAEFIVLDFTVLPTGAVFPE